LAKFLIPEYSSDQFNTFFDIIRDQACELHKIAERKAQNYREFKKHIKTIETAQKNICYYLSDRTQPIPKFIDMFNPKNIGFIKYILLAQLGYDYKFLGYKKSLWSIKATEYTKEIRNWTHALNSAMLYIVETLRNISIECVEREMPRETAAVLEICDLCGRAMPNKNLPALIGIRENYIAERTEKGHALCAECVAYSQTRCGCCNTQIINSSLKSLYDELLSEDTTNISQDHIIRQISIKSILQNFTYKGKGELDMWIGHPQHPTVGAFILNRKQKTIHLYCKKCAKKHLKFCNTCKKIGFDFKKVFPIKGKKSNPVEACFNCRSSYTICEQCGREFMKSITLNNRDRNHLINTKLCPICYTDSIAIHNYTYQPYFIENHGEKDVHDKFLIGFEHEVANIGENSNSNLSKYVKKDIQDHCNINPAEFIYAKHDGSIETHRGPGVEFVSYPFSWLYYKYLKRQKVFEVMFDSIGDRNFSGFHQKCGVHIHVSKNVFTQTHMYKFVSFFYQSENAEFIKKLSNRKKTKYCQFNLHKLISQEDKILFLKNKKNYPLLEGLEDFLCSFATGFKNAKEQEKLFKERYVAVNMTPKNTIEIRMFAGTQNANRFMGMLEFIFALYEYTKNVSFKDTIITKFISWIKTKEKKYPYALQLLTFNMNDGEENI